MHARTKRSRWPHWLFALHCAAVLFCVTGPGYRWWGSTPRPFVLGLPWSLAWVLIWLFATLFVLTLYFAWDRRSRG